MLYSLIYHIHIVTGMICFLIGPLQFIGPLRNGYPALHRLLGRAYAVGVLISAPTGFVISFGTQLWSAAVGTSLQSVVWLVVTIAAVQYIRAGNRPSHRRFMLRSYALVLAAPFIRLGVYVLEEMFGIDYRAGFDYYYPLLVWLSWSPLLAVEAYLALARSRVGSRK